MLRGSRRAVLQRIQPISIHGQVSLDVSFTFPEDSEQAVQVARLGPEAVSPDLRPGDVIRLEYLLGVVTAARLDET